LINTQHKLQTLVCSHIIVCSVALAEHFLLKKYMDILDQQRIQAIKPCYEYYGLMDQFPRLKDDLLAIRLKQIDKESKHRYKIGKWTAKFDASFNDMFIDTKLIIINKLLEKYHDFDQIIMRTVNQLKQCSYTQHKSKLPKNVCDLFDLELRYAKFDGNKFRFGISVIDINHMYDISGYHSAGGFYIIWDDLL